MTDGYFGADDCDLDDFRTLTNRTTTSSDVPLATEIEANIPIYDAAAFGDRLASDSERRDLMSEWSNVLGKGAGVIVLRQAITDAGVIDATTEVFNGIIAEEKQRSGGGADHFAASGANDRIWNSLQKLGEAAPDVFVSYFASPAIDAACEAWLGPGYQMTAQVNLVRPGGKAQEAHRDYHLGFQTAEVAGSYPAHVHDLSPVLTLQGGIAHCDMPIESGPTKLLPFSQLYRRGYVAWRRPDFRAHFEEACVQLPLAKGDAVFFNPALFHAAGENRCEDIHRMANLLQISSPFGRAMESINRERLVNAVYPSLLDAVTGGRLSGRALDAVIASTAEGYSFPTNLDTDPPRDGLAPKTQQALLAEAVAESWSSERLKTALAEQMARRRA